MAVFNHTAHKALWGWLADNPTKKKYEWPGWKQNGGEYHVVAEYCFACEYDGIAGNWRNRNSCRYCPLVCIHNDNCLDGYYYEWRCAGIANDWAERKRLAEKIRDWPVKDGVETI